MTLFAARRTITPFLTLATVAFASLAVANEPASAQNRPSSAGQRQPVAIVQLNDRLLVANRRSGTISVVGRDVVRVEAEFAVGRQLSHLAAVPGSQLLVASDEGASEILLLKWSARELEVLQRQPVAAAPVNVLVARSGNSLTVASLWARQISRWTIERQGDAPRLVADGVLELPFAPRLQLASPDDQHLIVADAFGPELAAIRREPLSLQSVYRIPGHNLRGLATSADGQELLIAHQMLNDFIPTTRDHVFWGNALTNLLRAIAWDRLVRNNDELRATTAQPVNLHGTLHPLGREGQAAGDPEQIAVTPRGETLVLLAGTGELARLRPDERRFSRLHVGTRPTALSVSADGKTAWIANRFADQLVVVDVDSLQIERKLSLAPAPARESLADRGERLFYDASLSLDGWFSCHSCHTDGHTCGLLNDNFGDDTMGAPKRIPSLLGTATTGPWAWHGRSRTLEQQVAKSLELTMRGSEHRPLDPAVTEALVAYLQTLNPPPPAAQGKTDAEAVARGQRVFAERSCDRCHAPPHYTSPAAYDVGLSDERGQTRFNPPSLRGLAYRRQLFHDNRMDSLRDLLSIHPPRDTATTPLTDTEVDDLLVFLLSL